MLVFSKASHTDSSGAREARRSRPCVLADRELGVHWSRPGLWRPTDGRMWVQAPPLFLAGTT